MGFGRSWRRGGRPSCSAGHTPPRPGHGAAPPPATGTPEVAGLFPHQALPLIRSLAGMRFCGFDVVEVAPPYDTAAQTTAALAAAIAYEFLALAALARPR